MNDWFAGLFSIYGGFTLRKLRAWRYNCSSPRRALLSLPVFLLFFHSSRFFFLLSPPSFCSTYYRSSSLSWFPGPFQSIFVPLSRLQLPRTLHSISLGWTKSCWPWKHFQLYYFAWGKIFALQRVLITLTHFIHSFVSYFPFYLHLHFLTLSISSPRLL